MTEGVQPQAPDAGKRYNRCTIFCCSGGSSGYVNVIHKTYPLTIGSVHRDLPLFAVGSGVSIAVLNILGDAELVEAAADELLPKIMARKPDVLVTPEAKSIPLAHALAVRTRLPYVVLRKSYKSYMGDALRTTTVSITAGTEQTLYMDAKDRERVSGARVVIIDDVISTGSTLEGIHSLVDLAGGNVVAEATVCTEGDGGERDGIIALAHLPLFT